MTHDGEALDGELVARLVVFRHRHECRILTPLSLEGEAVVGHGRVLLDRDGRHLCGIALEDATIHDDQAVGVSRFGVDIDGLCDHLLLVVAAGRQAHDDRHKGDDHRNDADGLALGAAGHVYLQVDS